MHIGKTAGTSFYFLLCEMLHNLPHYHGSPEQFDKVSAKELKTNDLITGHFSFAHTSKFNSDRYLITELNAVDV